MQVSAEKRSQYYLVLNTECEEELHGGILCSTVIADTWEALLRNTADRIAGISVKSYKLYLRTVLVYKGQTYVSQTDYQDITSIHPKLLSLVAASPRAGDSASAA